MSLTEIVLDEAEEKITFLFQNRRSEKFDQIFDRTRTFVQKAYDKLPERAETNYYMALIHQLQGDIESATPYYEVAMELDPENPNIMADRGVGLVRAKRYKEGIALLEQAREINPKDKILRRSLGHGKITYAQQLLEEDDYKTAKELANQACKLLPRDPDICIRFGNSLMQKGAVVFAEMYYKRALARLPKRDPRYNKIESALPDLYFRSPSQVGVTEDGRPRLGPIIWI